MADFTQNTQLDDTNGKGWEEVTGFTGTDVVVQNVDTRFNLHMHVGATEPDGRETGFILGPLQVYSVTVDTSLWFKGKPSEVHISVEG